MHAGDDVRSSDVEDLIAALVSGEVVESWLGRLEHRPHRAIRDDDAACERFAQRLHDAQAYRLAPI